MGPEAQGEEGGNEAAEQKPILLFSPIFSPKMLYYVIFYATEKSIIPGILFNAVWTKQSKVDILSYTYAKYMQKCLSVNTMEAKDLVSRLLKQCGNMDLLDLFHCHHCQWKSDTKV